MSKILVIDDDADFLLAMQMVLKANGFEMETATTPKEGIDKVLSTRPDLVVLDVMMPTGYEGFAVARDIREKHSLTQLPVVILTNVHGAREVPYRFAPDKDYLPVDVFLDKPIEPDMLVDTIRGLLGEAREEPEYPL
jgi:DNA-binding response OmpR family regulator